MDAPDQLVKSFAVCDANRPPKSPIPHYSHVKDGYSFKAVNDTTKPSIHLDYDILVADTVLDIMSGIPVISDDF
jgi:hypothetical protein